MKQLALTSLISSLSAFVLLTMLLANVAAAQIQYYEINTILNQDGRSSVKLIITFARPEPKFYFNIIGRIENFQAKSMVGPMNCTVEVSGTSFVECDLNLTWEKREIEVSFETDDFVKSLDKKFYFGGDFSLDKDTNRVFASLRLPENAFLVGESMEESMEYSRISFPENASAFITEGGRIMITWKLSDISKDTPLRLEVLYEQVEPPFWFQLRIRHFILFGAVFAIVLGFFIMRYFRRSEKLVLSVLDEYERKVMNIVAAEGEVKQRKVVQLTNFSKAKVSRVVKALAERGLIKVERVGRTNRLKLVKKKFRI